jgi:hypothetical protein
MYPCGAVGPSPRSGEAETSPEAEARVGRGHDSSRGWALGSGEAETSSRGRGRGRARTRFLLRPRLRPSHGVGRGGDLLPRPRPKVGRGRASCCARGWTRLLSVLPRWVAQQSERGEQRCFPVRSVSERAKWLRSLGPCQLRRTCQDKESGGLRIECACDTVGWWGDLAKVASRRSLPELGFGRAEGAPTAWGRGVNSSGTTVPARGRARARRDCVPW